MKLKYILGAFLSVALVTACQTEPMVGSFADFKTDKTFVSIALEGGSSTVTITAADVWEVTKHYDTGKKDDDNKKIYDYAPSWITLSATSGSAGESKLTITATETPGGRETELQLKSGSKLQHIIVRQGTVEAEDATCKEVMEGPEGKNFKVTGKVTKIANTTYGNLYIDDGTYDGFSGGNADGVYIYGTLDKDGKEKNFLSLGIEVGDVITVHGPKTNYNGTVELVNVMVDKIEKALLSIVDVEPSLGTGILNTTNLPADGGDVTVKITYKGNGAYCSLEDGATEWISLKNTEFSPGIATLFEKNPADTVVYTFAVAPNDAEARIGGIAFTSSDLDDKGKKVSTEIAFEITQDAGFAAMPLPYEETFLASKGGWEAIDIIPVEGVESIWSQSTQYGMKATSTKKVAAQSELISPFIDLSTVSSAVLSFEHVQRYAGDVYQELKLFVTADNGETWDELLIPVWSTGKDWNYVSSGDISLKKFAGKLINIKFQYNSTASSYATWEIKNLSVKEGEPTITSVAGIVDNTVSAETEWTGTFADAIVTYVNGGNAFIEDGTAGIQLYKKEHGLKVGQKINGTVSGKVKLYNGYAELTDLDYSKAEVTDGDAPEATVITLEALLNSYLRWQNCQVKLEGITFDTAITKENRNGVISQNDSTIAAYAQVKNTLELSGTGDLVCWPTRYNANLQVGCWDNAHFTAK